AARVGWVFGLLRRSRWLSLGDRRQPRTHRSVGAALTRPAWLRVSRCDDLSADDLSQAPDPCGRQPVLARRGGLGARRRLVAALAGAAPARRPRACPHLGGD